MHFRMTYKGWVVDNRQHGERRTCIVTDKRWTAGLTDNKEKRGHVNKTDSGWKMGLTKKGEHVV